MGRHDTHAFSAKKVQGSAMSDSPIFSQLATEFAAKGAKYEDLVQWSTPAFRWSGSDYVVQLDKPKSGISLEKLGMYAAEGFISGLTAGVQPLSAKQLPARVHADVLEASGVTFDASSQKMLQEAREAASDDTLNFGTLISDYIAQVGKSFAKAHPLAVVTDMHSEQNADGSVAVVIEAVQPITSVQPLSERNTAEPME
jgi:hypothetical protein